VLGALCVFLSDVRQRYIEWEGVEGEQGTVIDALGSSSLLHNRIVFISIVAFAFWDVCEFVCSRQGLKERWGKKGMVLFQSGKEGVGLRT